MDFQRSNFLRGDDPSLGRYIEHDPLGLAAGPNLFGYAFQNPVQVIDPMGLDGDGVTNPNPTLQLNYAALTAGNAGGGDAQVVKAGEAVQEAVAASSPAAAPSQDCSCDLPPSAFDILPDQTPTKDSDTYKDYSYQLVNEYGHPLTGTGYTGAEHVTPNGINTNDNFGEMPNGVFSDRLGWDDSTGYPTQDQSKTRTQTFTVKCHNVSYPDLKTNFEHTNSYENGVYNHTVRDITPKENTQ